MTIDDVERLIKKHGAITAQPLMDLVVTVVFEATAAEREACAKVCEAQQNIVVARHPARIEVEHSTQNMMALKCAAAIRARGEDNE